MSGIEGNPTLRPVERDGRWDGAGGLAAADRPLSAGPPAEPESRTGVTYRDSFLVAHDWLREQLDAILAVVRELVGGHITAVDARARVQEQALARHRWDLSGFCAAYCQILRNHHHREDVEMFRAVLDVDPRLTDVIGRLEAEHEVVAEISDRLDRALVELVREQDGPGDTRMPARAAELLAEIDAVASRLSELLRSHLAYEEDELHDALGRVGLRLR